MVLDAAWLIPALPLTGFVVLLVFGRRLGDPWAGWLATAMTTAAFVVSIVMLASLLGRAGDERSVTHELFTWLPVGGLQVKAGLLLDPLSITMALFITGVGALIHLYSIGYMHGDESYSKFFVYLNLFAFSMLVLVLADSFLFSFLGWEGVGACSYFLISFWFERDTAASAGKKAFVTNRVGDFGFMIAMFLMFSALGSLQYGVVLTGAGDAHQDDGDRDRAAAVPRRRRQVRAAAALRVAARRDGGPDAGVGAHPRGDDGDRGRLPDVPHQPHPRAGAGCAHDHRHRRR